MKGGYLILSSPWDFCDEDVDVVDSNESLRRWRGGKRAVAAQGSGTEVIDEGVAGSGVERADAEPPGSKSFGLRSVESDILPRMLRDTGCNRRVISAWRSV